MLLWRYSVSVSDISFIWFGLRANFSAADLESLTDLAFLGRRYKGKSAMIACTSGC